MTKDHYKIALQAARDELAELEREKAKIEKRISELQQGIVGLSALAADEAGGEKPQSMMDVLAGVGVETGLTDAVRMITSSFGFPMTPKQVRDALLHLGYDLSGYSNILASLHTIMKRLATAKELINVTDDAGKEIGAYIWNPAVPVRRSKLVTASSPAVMSEPPKRNFPLEKRVAQRLRKEAPAWWIHLTKSDLVLDDPPHFADGKRLTPKQQRAVTRAIEQEKRPNSE